MPDLIVLNPVLDRSTARARFAAAGRAQLRDVLAPAAAEALHDVLARQTPWGIAWQAGRDGPHSLRQHEIEALPPEAGPRIGQAVTAAMRGRDYAFLYSSYPLVTAYLQRWAPGHALEALLEQLNAPAFLDLVREVTGDHSLVKADGQATLYSANQFLGLHDDLGSATEGRRVAYVLNLCRPEWRPEWGGYLHFYDEGGNGLEAYRPSWNTLNLFTVGQPHAVGFVPPFAPIGRFAVTGWFRDR